VLKKPATHVFAVMPAKAGIQLITDLNKPKYLDTGSGLHHAGAGPRRCDEFSLD
jgi:hypothetical protein